MANVHPFDLEWLGGPAEKHFRAVRPGVDELPWGTLKAERYPERLVDRARVSWTEAAYNEYCTAAAFADLLRALLEARAPVDLIGMASDFVADEILHVELTSRVAMELGGGAPYVVDFSNLSFPPMTDRPPLERAAEMVVRLCCVGEAFSVSMLAGCYKSAAHPLTRAVLERIVKDEAPHGRLGWLFLDWAADLLSADEKARLSRAALAAIAMYSPLWQKLQSRVQDGVTTEGFLVDHVHELGWMESQAYARTARATIREDVVKPLSRYGIVLTTEELRPYLDPPGVHTSTPDAASEPAPANGC